MGEVCSTENGICNAPPGCKPGVGCPAVCYGACVPACRRRPGLRRDPLRGGQDLLQSSCGICAGPNEGCTKQICVPPAGGGACMTDADCRVAADYCTGCDCRALATGQSLPPCSGPGVRCLRDPCTGSEGRLRERSCASSNESPP